MIEIKFNLSKLNGSKWINWVKSMWMKYELGMNKGKTKRVIKEIYLENKYKWSYVQSNRRRDICKTFTNRI